MRSVTFSGLVFSTAMAAISQAGCLCPPCPAGAGATTAAAPAGGGGGGTTTTASSSSKSSPNRLLIWDGDKTGSGQSWADCAKKDQKCKSTLTKTSGAGVNGSTGLKWHGEGPDWMGAGWNWFGWWPQGSGTDVSAYNSLTFEVKLEAKSPELAPEGDALSFGLNCSKGDKCVTARVPIHKYVADYADGQWHKVVIPMDDLTNGDGKGFDKTIAWEFDFTNWSGTPRDFTVYVDNIAFEK